MRVTPSTPSPRGSVSTASHFSSQAQTPIQGMAQWEAVLRGGGGDRDLDVVLLQTKSPFKGHSLHRPCFIKEVARAHLLP